jgi:hypothetical protein
VRWSVGELKKWEIQRKRGKKKVTDRDKVERGKQKGTVPE